MSDVQAHVVVDEDEAAFIAAVEEGLRSLQAGHEIDLEQVAPWLLSWGTDEELPPPVCG